MDKCFTGTSSYFLQQTHIDMPKQLGVKHSKISLQRVNELCEANTSVSPVIGCIVKQVYN